MSSNGKAPKPVFDFSGVSRQWSLSFMKSAQAAARAQLTLQRPIRAGMSEDAIQAYYDAQDAALDKISELSDEQLDLIVQVLKDVPREWLIAGAPDDLDWGNKEHYDWIQDERYTELLNMVMSGEARKLAKN
jgi:hypothetical protein